MILSQTGLMWVVFSTTLIVWILGGTTALHGGLLRPKNTAGVAAVKIAEVSLAAILFLFIGHALLAGTSAGGWLGRTGFLGFDLDSPGELALFVYQLLLCAATTTIVSGAAGERMTFRAALALGALVAGILFPVFAHWVWAHEGTRAVGWLRRAGFVDQAGGAAVHSVAGWASLAALLVVGNRSGRYARSGKLLPFGRASIPLASLGLVVAWIGWIGAIGGGAADSLDDVPRVILCALVASAASGAAALGMAMWARGRVDVEDAVRGVLAGIAAVSAGAREGD